MITFVRRMIQAIKLDDELYEEIPVNHSFIFQSIAIIFLSSLCAGIAKYPDDGATGLILVTVISIFCWVLWGYVTFFMSELLLQTNQSIDFMEVIRITGFASTPGILRILGIIPGFFGIVFFITGIWMLVMMAITIKHAYDMDILRALGVSAVGGVIQAAIFVIFI